MSQTLRLVVEFGQDHLNLQCMLIGGKWFYIMCELELIVVAYVPISWL